MVENNMYLLAGNNAAGEATKRPKTHVSRNHAKKVTISKSSMSIFNPYQGNGDISKPFEAAKDPMKTFDEPIKQPLA